jgi:hypothetical protein
MKRIWVYNPHRGGIKIPLTRQLFFFKQEAEKFSQTCHWSSVYQINLRFKSQFCYLDAIKKGEDTAFPVLRLRYFRDDAWSLAFYTYSNNSYHPSFFFKWKLGRNAVGGNCCM